MKLAKPTFAQEDYAAGLVEKLRDEESFKAERFAQRVYKCQDRLEMSRLIDRMKRLLVEIRQADEEAGIGY
jgi:hypothetical protein